jgi:hypothetical protein
MRTSEEIIRQSREQSLKLVPFVDEADALSKAPNLTEVSCTAVSYRVLRNQGKGAYNVVERTIADCLKMVHYAIAARLLRTEWTYMLRFPRKQ